MTLSRTVAAVVAAAMGLLAAVAITTFVVAPLLGYRLLAVESDSMSPAILRGDLIITRPASAENIEAGDVVVFWAGGDGIPTVHRVLGKNEIELHITDEASGESTSQTEYRLVTKGDNNPAPDSQEVTADRIVGEVWFTVSGAGSLAGWPLRLVLMVLFATVVGIWAVWELGLAVRARRKASGLSGRPAGASEPAR